MLGPVRNLILAQPPALRPEELVDLEMPAMTMVFVLGDPAMLAQLEVGKEIEFIADRVNGKLTVTELR